MKRTYYPLLHMYLPLLRTYLSLHHTFSPLQLMYSPALCRAAVRAARRLLPAIFLVLSGMNAYGQDISLGLFSVTDSVKGFQANVIQSIARRNAYGLQASGVLSLSSRMSGVQVAAFSNVCATPFRGLQMSAVSNIAMGVKRGVQMSGLSNISSSTMRGLQVGAYNYADTLSGSQIGIINVCTSHPRGVQIGLVNYSRDTVAHKVGLVNVNPNTRIDLALYGGNSTKTNVALRFRNRSTYNIIGVGSHFLGFDEDFSGAFFYRIGQYWQVSPRVSLSGDVGFYHVETFEKNSATKPERLYSLQARINADYQLNKTLSAFASLGYGTTRHYDHNAVYRSRAIAEAGVAMRYRRPAASMLAKPVAGGSRSIPDSVMASAVYARPWLAVGEAAGVNVLVHSFDRFVMNADFAQTTMHSMRNNFRRGLVWDNDQFSTNLFAHPYHGGLYFNSARSNGLSFWQSAPYSLGGSLMWEFLGEIEPPAINDLIATTMGGIAIGEITHRVSRLVLDDRDRGGRRFLREAAHTLINPIGSLNRMIRGDAWRVRSRGYLYHDHVQVPVELRLSAGTRYLADDGATFRGEWNPYVDLLLNYGDALDIRHNQPYDYFSANVTFGLSRNQPLISGVHLLGRLWGVNVHEGRNMTTMFGLFQHFNYYDSEPIKNGSDRVPYRISEAASFGPGLICRFENVGNLGRLEQRIFLNGIALGGSLSDHFKWIDRDYNMGSGFSAKVQTQLEFPRFGRFALATDFYRIFTWKGYEKKDLEEVNPLFLNVQGDKSNAMLFVARPTLEVFLGHGANLELSVSNYLRRTNYTYHDNIHSHTYEARIGLTASF